MDTAIIPLDFESNAVRSVMIDGKPWWVAVDVCRTLEIQNASQALKPLFDDQKGVYRIYTLKGEQTMNIVSLPGLFMLLSRSDKPVARRMMRWVTEDVLPALLTDGYYELPGSDGHDLPAKRAYYALLPEAHQERALAKEAALARVAELIAVGARKTHAIAEVAEDTGISRSTIWTALRQTYMVRKADHAAALAPQWAGAEKPLAPFHPDALQAYVAGLMAGLRKTQAYRRMMDLAAEAGWSPIPCSKTVDRHAKRLMPGRTPHRAIPRPTPKQEAA